MTEALASSSLNPMNRATTDSSLDRDPSVTRAENTRYTPYVTYVFKRGYLWTMHPGVPRNAGYLYQR